MNSNSPQDMSQQIQHCSTMEYILIGDLRDLLEEGDDEVTRHWLTVVLEALLNNLPRQFALQQEDGFLEEVLENYPTWYRHVEQLKRQQEELFEKLKALHQLLIEKELFREIAGELRSDLKDWIASLTAYHRHERRLVQSAWNMEIGGGD